MTFNTSRDAVSLRNLPQPGGSGTLTQNIINSRRKHPNVPSRHNMTLLCIADKLSSGRKAVGRNDGAVEGHGLQDYRGEPFKV